MNKRYDGILICSDVDGTLVSGGRVAERNLEALRMFMENGGRFTYCTGRDGSGLAERPIAPANAPMIGLCGGEIFDTVSHRPLERYPIDGDLPRLLHRIAGLTAVTEFQICDGIKSFNYAPDEVPGGFDFPVLKVVVVARDPFGDCLLPDGVEETCRGICSVGSNGGSTFELVAYGHDKGAGALRVKELCGAAYLIGVGDNQADLALLRAADFGVAVERAIPALKAIADRVVCTAWDGAIADVIDLL